jgi:acyl-CoA synthetase (AMP-forming)/AMP-acid ligase II
MRVPGKDLSEGELIAHCKELIAGYKSPRSIAFVDALPVSGAGKVLKIKLREPFRHRTRAQRRLNAAFC